MVVSCGSTKEMEVEEEPKETTERAVVNREVRKKTRTSLKVDPEKLAAQLGLSEDQEQEFLAMWSTTGEAMRIVRVEHRGDKEVFRAKMKEARSEREEGLKSILNEEQLARYYNIMEGYRNKLSSKRRRGGY